jgi:hypothetical protein
MSLIPVCVALDGGIHVGDIPTSYLDIDVFDETGGNALIHSVYDAVTIDLFQPNGEASTAELTGTIQNNHNVHAAFDWETSPFDGPGIWELRLTFTTTEGTITAAEPLRFVVELIDGWLTIEQTRQRWADAPLDLTYLYSILRSAKIQCVAYAPALALDEPVPTNYLQAQLMQTRAIYTAFIANQNDNIDGQFPVRVFPMDWNIKALLRPKTGIPRVG